MTKKGIYLLPNLLTTSSLFAGFYAIVAAMKTQFEVAAVAIFIAMIMDTLDGRVARMTGTASQFGAQYDSLSDMLSFGVAPALVVYHWGLMQLGKVGWLAAFCYTACTALRLARFNVQSSHVDKRFFVGLPCPLAAAVIASLVWIGADLAFSGNRLGLSLGGIVVCVALLMVSPIRYYSFKDFRVKDKVPFVVPLVFVLLVMLIAWDPPKVLCLVSSLYVLSGPLYWVKRRYFRHSRRHTKD